MPTFLEQDEAGAGDGRATRTVHEHAATDGEEHGAEHDVDNGHGQLDPAKR